jgi:hypothetical protein
MFPYNNRLVDYVASFPAAVFEPLDVRNVNPDGEAIVGEAGTVPASADYQGKRRLNLDQVPLEQVGMTIEVDGNPRTIIPYGETPSAGQVAVSMTTGVMEFHSSDAGEAVVVDYTGKGTPIMAFLVHQLAGELEATQETVADMRGLAAVADATGSGDAHTQLNLLLAELRTAGILLT